MKPLTPQLGDIVVTREAAVERLYTVRQLPGDPQFRVPRQDEALRLGWSFARQHAVDLWYAENGATRLLAASRPETASRAQLHAKFY
jgi:hypothetical protein